MRIRSATGTGTAPGADPEPGTGNRGRKGSFVELGIKLAVGLLAAASIAAVFLAPQAVRFRAAGLAAVLSGVALLYFFKWPPTLGLDLQGGVHLVLRVNDQDIIDHEHRTIQSGLDTQFSDKQIAGYKFHAEPSYLELTFADAAQADAARPVIKTYLGDGNATDWDGLTVRIRVSSDYLREIRQRTIVQTIDTIDRRINEMGVTEPVIHPQGTNKIVIQLAGQSSSARWKGVIQRTAVLRFMLVESQAPTRRQLLESHGDKVPDGYEVFPEKDEITGKETAWFLVKMTPVVDGSLLENAFLTADQDGAPATGFRFGPDGARQFGELTGSNRGKQLAIVLDNVIKSAPVIRAKISRDGIISGNFTQQSAQDLAVVLRSGPLPVKITIVEERSVGPTLGRDSIAQGVKAMAIGTVLVLVFMAFYYRLGGVVANLAVITNAIIVVGVMLAFNAVFTLPGIAGLALTIGMGVDANVLIFERIREEIYSGKTVRSAVEAGYDRAFTTIFDGNLTTLITGFVLFIFGTGPIKGFAVVLVIGLVSNLFTAYWCTRIYYDGLVQSARPKELSI